MKRSQSLIFASMFALVAAAFFLIGRTTAPAPDLFAVRRPAEAPRVRDAAMSEWRPEEVAAVAHRTEAVAEEASPEEDVIIALQQQVAQLVDRNEVLEREYASLMETKSLWMQVKMGNYWRKAMDRLGGADLFQQTFGYGPMQEQAYGFINNEMMMPWNMLTPGQVERIIGLMGDVSAYEDAAAEWRNLRATVMEQVPIEDRTTPDFFSTDPRWQPVASAQSYAQSLRAELDRKLFAIFEKGGESDFLRYYTDTWMME